MADDVHVPIDWYFMIYRYSNLLPNIWDHLYYPSLAKDHFSNAFWYENSWKVHIQ